MVYTKKAMTRSFFQSFFGFLKVLLISLLIVVPLRLLIVQPFFVQGQSMEPNFEPFDYLLADQVSYFFKEPERGEVVIFRFPQNPDQFYIKRVIGLPGETIKIDQGQVIIVNSEHPDGFVLDESQYLAPQTKTSGHLSRQLREDEYFVMGDNRATSYDSRRWGVLPGKMIVGKVWLRLWPFNKAQAVTAPQYSE